MLTPPVGGSQGPMTNRARQPAPRAVRNAHIKYEGIQPHTLKRNKHSILRFFTFLSMHGRCLPDSFESLDEEVAEYINHLYLDDFPQYWAVDLLSGLKRFYPKCRRHLETSHLYQKNWLRVTVRQKAIPASLDLVLGMGAAALLEGDFRLAFSILLGFVGLLDCILRNTSSDPYRASLVISLKLRC